MLFCIVELRPGRFFGVRKTNDPSADGKKGLNAAKIPSLVQIFTRGTFLAKDYGRLKNDVLVLANLFCK